MSNFNFPIVIFSSNRSNYFRKVIDSLISQTIDFNYKSVYLFSDSNGCENSRANINYFSEYFNVSNIILDCVESRGIANSRWIAEKYIFNELNCTWCLFLEDDLVLSPIYLENILTLFHTFKERNLLPIIGKISCYGHLDNSDFIELNGGLISLKHSWGSLESKKQWEISYSVLNLYTELVNFFGYNQRYDDAILAFYKLLGFSWDFPLEPRSMSSQDNFRTALNLISGQSRINTYLCFAHYIGSVGTNFNDDDYIKCGYDVDKTSNVKISDNNSFDQISKNNIIHNLNSSQKYLYKNKILNEENYIDISRYIDIDSVDKSILDFFKLSFIHSLQNFNYVVIDSNHDSFGSVIFSLDIFLKFSENVLLLASEFPNKLIIYISDDFPYELLIRILNTNLNLFLFVDHSCKFSPLIPNFTYQIEGNFWHPFNFYINKATNIILFNPYLYKLKSLNNLLL
jgi:hypothetical protein